MTTLDWVVAAAISLFALWGFLTGAARQIARFVAMGAAFAGAGPAGTFLGLPLANQLRTSLTIGTVIGTVSSFVVIYLLLSMVVTAVLRRLFDGPQERRGVDRVLGMLIGAGMAAGIAYIGLCAAEFLERNTTIGGRTIAFTPKNAQVMKVVHWYNLLEAQQFGGLREAVNAAHVATDQHLSAGLKNNPDLQALQRDARFRRISESPAMKHAIETGDFRELLHNDAVIELIQDPKAFHHLERVAGFIHEGSP